MDHIYAVHTVRPDEGAGAVEIVFPTEEAARRYARSRSHDHRILSASVTRYRSASSGPDTPLAWFRDGDEQQPRAPRPGRLYPTDGAPLDGAATP